MNALYNQQPRCFSMAGPVLSLVLIFFLAACGAETEDATAITEEETTTQPSNTVITQLQQDQQFSTLTTAIDSARFTETLSGEGPFTVFAPTNQAFDQFLQETGMPAESLLTQQSALQSILSRHVIQDSLTADSLRNVTEPLSAMEGQVTVNNRNDTLLVGDAQVVSVDTTAANGIIYVIDRVIVDTAEVELETGSN